MCKFKFAKILTISLVYQCIDLEIFEDKQRYYRSIVVTFAVFLGLTYIINQQTKR